MRFIGVALSALALLSGCASPQPVVVPARTARVAVPRSDAGAQEGTRILARYRRERGCEGPAYAAARRYAADRLESVASAPTEAGAIPDAAENGRFRLQLARMAARKRCFDAARTAYGEVNDIFTGDAYASLRQRADKGLSALPRR